MLAGENFKTDKYTPDDFRTFTHAGKSKNIVQVVSHSAPLNKINGNHLSLNR